MSRTGRWRGKGGQVLVGAIAGALVALVAGVLFDSHEPPVSLSSFAPFVVAGAIIGAFVTVLAGRRRISVFWPYLVATFGLVALIPWWSYPKDGSYLPLGAVYVSPTPANVVALTSVLHLSSSVALAAGVTVLHRRLAFKSLEDSN